MSIFYLIVFLNKHQQLNRYNFHTACSKPPAITDGNYDADLLDKYTKGDIVQFTCDEETLTYPSTSTIECGESDWMENATCTRRKQPFLNCTLDS